MQAARGASLNPSDQSDPTSSYRPRRRYLPVFAVIAGVGYLLDLGTKTLAVDRLTGRPPVPVLGDLLRFDLHLNSGAAFSIGTSYTVLLSLVAIGALLFVLWTARRLGSLGWAVGLGFLLAGVAGNLTDRLFRAPGPLRGHVVDFFALPSFPVFNVADICINIAAAMIILQALRGVRVDGRREREVTGEATS